MGKRTVAMTVPALLIIALVSAAFFPWPVTAALAVFASFFVPMAAFALGIFMDALYYNAHVAYIPYATCLGALASILFVFVRSRLKTGTIGE